MIITIYLYIFSMPEEAKCPKCGKVPKYTQAVGQAFNSHVCSDSCGYQFWTLRLCPHCKSPERTVFLNKPNFGQKITCLNCNFSMYYFRCPKHDCLQLFYKDQIYYRMGNRVSCITCGLSYKVVTCACGGETFLNENQIIFEGYNLFKCRCCAKEFTYTICPSCFSPEFHVDKLDVGDRIRCGTCKLWRKYVPCPKCGKTLRGERFSFCQPNKCQQCFSIFEYSKCPYGCAGVNFNFLTKAMGPARDCFTCKSSYFVINCKKCQNSLYLQRIDKSIGTTEFCPHCKVVIKYYLCGKCGQFNDKDACCANKTCPPPSLQADSTKLKEKQSEKKKSEQNPPDEQCKICYSGKVEVINQTCAHLMMCQNCLKSIQQRNRGSANIPCPICKQIGRYFKFKKPIYS